MQTERQECNNFGSRASRRASYRLATPAVGSGSQLCRHNQGARGEGGGGGGCLKGEGNVWEWATLLCQQLFHVFTKIDSQAVESYINISKCEQKEAFSAAWSLANQKSQCKIVEYQ